MKIWCRVVCDEHKVYRDFFVSNPSLTANYLARKDVLIQYFLTEHYNCGLRLAITDEELDKLHDEGYEKLDWTERNFKPKET